MQTSTGSLRTRVTRLHCIGIPLVFHVLGVVLLESTSVLCKSVLHPPTHPHCACAECSAHQGRLKATNLLSAAGHVRRRKSVWCPQALANSPPPSIRQQKTRQHRVKTFLVSAPPHFAVVLQRVPAVQTVALFAQHLLTQDYSASQDFVPLAFLLTCRPHCNTRVREVRKHCSAPARACS